MKKTYFIHESSYVDEPVSIGCGTSIWHFSHIMKNVMIGENCNIGQNVMIASGVKIGNHVKIQNNVSIYNGVEIEDDVFLGPSCVLTNISNPRSQVNRQNLYEKTLLSRGCSIGANATILCGHTIGRYAMIGAGSVVTRDVPDYGLVLGVPGQLAGWVSRHGHPLHKNEEGLFICPETHFRYQETDPGKLNCLDLDENDPLPETLRTGKYPYSNFKIK